jgi:hypothetical protein
LASERASASEALGVERVCENCAFPDDDLALVRRVYVTPESWDRPAAVEIVEDTELWCVSCQSQYPNEPAGAETDESEA